MAQSRSFFDDVKRELECSVCQEQFSETNEPKILKCLHTFCKSCLEAWLRQQGGGALSCPTCRQITECPNNDMNSLPSNLFYKQMVDIVKAYSGQGQEDSPHCGNCDERKSLKFYCSECNHFLCEDCTVAHKKMKALSGHQIKEIGKFKPSDARDYARRANVCKKHNDEVRFYCEQCVVCICRDCAILDHREHNIVSLDTGLKKKRSELESKMQEVQVNIYRLRSEKESLEKQRIRINNSFEQATEEIHRTAERNREMIRQHEASMTERLKKQKDAFDAAFSNTMTGLDEKLNETVSSLDFGKDVLERNNLPEILNVEEMLEQRFQELIKPCELVKVNYSTVKYIADDLSSLKDSPGKLVTTNTEPLSTTVDGMSLTEAVQGDDCTFTVITNDSQGNKTYSEIDKVGACIQSLQKGKPLKVTITDSQDGCYKVSYKPEAAGEFNVFITVSGEAIIGSPFKLKVRERKSKVKGTNKKQQVLSVIGPQPSSMMNKNMPKCSECMNMPKDHVYQSECGHFFCKSCKKLLNEKTMICPACKQENLFRGNQPVGHMTWRNESYSSLPGYEKFGTILLTFNFDSGFQGPDHPKPGQPYCGLFCTSYLPNNAAGQEVCSLLRRAFDARLLFTIGKCSATRENRVVSDGIELKTNRSGGPDNGGYPDPSYLDRVKSQLAETGITQPLK